MANEWSNTSQERQRAPWSDLTPSVSILWLRSRGEVNDQSLALQKAFKAQGIRFKVVDVFDVQPPQLSEADLILLDAFDRLDGTVETILSRIRLEYRIPLVMLTNGYSTDQLVTALTAGADAIWTVTLPVEVLMARCKAILRRARF